MVLQSHNRFKPNFNGGLIGLSGSCENKFVLPTSIMNDFDMNMMFIFTVIETMITKIFNSYDSLMFAGT